MKRLKFNDRIAIYTSGSHFDLESLIIQLSIQEQKVVFNELLMLPDSQNKFTLIQSFVNKSSKDILLFLFENQSSSSYVEIALRSDAVSLKISSLEDEEVLNKIIVFLAEDEDRLLDISNDRSHILLERNYVANDTLSIDKLISDLVSYKPQTSFDEKLTISHLARVMDHRGLSAAISIFEANNSLKESRSATKYFATKLFYHDRLLALNWLAAKINIIPNKEMLSELTCDYFNSSSWKASEWVNSLPQSLAKDYAVAGKIQYLIINNDYQSAASLISHIQDAALQSNVKAKISRN